MGVKERQEREREAMTRAILDAARELFVAEGYHNVSIRKIAERIEYSPGSIYSYFSSKDDIFFALAEEGFRLLAARDSTCPGHTDPLERIRSAFWRVYEFSKSHPEYFALMFVDRTVPKISRGWKRSGFVPEMRAEVGAVIQQAIQSGLFPKDTDPDAAFRILLTAINGAAISRLCDRAVAGEDADALARDTLEATLAGLRAGFSRTFHPVACDHVGD